LSYAKKGEVQKNGWLFLLLRLCALTEGEGGGG